MRKRKRQYQTIGVRFIGTANIYTYKAPIKAKIILGDLLYVESPFKGPSLVAVVQLNAPMPDGFTMDTLKPIKGKVVLL